jgi:acetone carboxylase gamma subunit
MFPCTKKDCKKEYARKVNPDQHIQNVQKLICPHCGIGFSLCCRSNFKIMFYDMYVQTLKSRNAGALMRVA